MTQIQIAKFCIEKVVILDHPSGELAQNMRRAEICCSQSDTAFYQSVFAGHVPKICDNNDTIEEDVCETNVRKFLEVTDTNL